MASGPVELIVPARIAAFWRTAKWRLFVAMLRVGSSQMSMKVHLHSNSSKEKNHNASKPWAQSFPMLEILTPIEISPSSASEKKKTTFDRATQMVRTASQEPGLHSVKTSPSCQVIRW